MPTRAVRGRGVLAGVKRAASSAKMPRSFPQPCIGRGTGSRIEDFPSYRRPIADPALDGRVVQ